jgi:DNA-binding response OmpR family regulator
MIKILIASSAPNVRHKIYSKTNELKFDIAETGEEIFLKLKQEKYDCLIADENMIDIDIWSIARFINANINSTKSERLPIFVIEDKGIEQPRLLTSNYKIKTIDLKNSVEIESFISKGSIDKPTILIIEDDFNAAEGMKIGLEDEYDVDVFHTAQEGFQCWKQKKHDLILLDLMLPGASGEDTLKEIRKVNPQQTIVIVSARSELNIQQQLLLLGANDYLAKPFSPESLNKTCRVSLTLALYQYELNRKERKLDQIVEKLCLALDTLEKDEVDETMEIINRIISSMPERITSDDYQLNKEINLKKKLNGAQNSV